MSHGEQSDCVFRSGCTQPERCGKEGRCCAYDDAPKADPRGGKAMAPFATPRFSEPERKSESSPIDKHAPTPRTDAEIGRVHLSEGRNMVTADFARQLERDLAEERAVRQRLDHAWDAMQPSFRRIAEALEWDGSPDVVCDQAASEIRKLRALVAPSAASTPERETEAMVDAARGIMQILRGNPGCTEQDVFRHCRARGDSTEGLHEHDGSFVTEARAAAMIWRAMTRVASPSSAAPLMADEDVMLSLSRAKDQAYLERNYAVAALARAFPSGIRKTAIEGWSEDWHGCVYIDLPSGQVSYHYHDSQAFMFEHLPPYTKPWDGHDKNTVHYRLLAVSSHATTLVTEAHAAAEVMEFFARNRATVGTQVPSIAELQEWAALLRRLAPASNERSSVPVAVEEMPPCDFCVHTDVPMTDAPCIDCKRIGFGQWSQYKPRLGPPAWGDVLHFLMMHNAWGLGRIVYEGIALIDDLKAQLASASATTTNEGSTK